jgi:transposase-like protein
VLNAAEAERVRAPSGLDPRLDELIASWGGVEGTRAFLEELRWPDGVTCLRCASNRIVFLVTRARHQCRDCGYQFRVTVGTAMHDSHVPPPTWLYAVHLMLRAEEGYPARQLHALSGGSYKTWWFVEHRIRIAMSQALGGGLRLLEQRAGKAYHRPSPKHLDAYRAETGWRGGHAGMDDAFRRTVHALLTATPTTYLELTKARRRPVATHA